MAAVKLESSGLSGKLEGRINNQEREKSIESFVELKGREIQMVNAFKIDYKKTSSSGAEDFDIKVMMSESQQFSPQSVILETNYRQANRDPIVEIQFMTATKNSLRQYFIFDYQIEGELKYMTSHRVLVPIKLEKFEFQTGLGSWNVRSFVRKSEDAYSSSFKIIRGSEALVAAGADLKLQGQPGQDFVATASATGKVGTMAYKGDSRVELGQSKMAATINIIRSRDNLKIMALDTSYQRTQPFSAQFMVESQVMSEGIKFEAKAAQGSSNQYQTKIGLTRGSRSIILLQGPVTIVLSPLVTKLETDLTLNSNYRLVAALMSQYNKQQLKVHLEQQQQPIFVIELNSEVDRSQELTTSAKLMVPRLIDGNMDIKMTETVIHATTNTQLLPNTQYVRRIKAFTDVNLDTRTVHTDIAWDADRDQNKKLSAQAQIMSFSRQPLKATIQSLLVWKGANYRIKTEVEPGRLSGDQSPMSLKMEVTTPAQQTHMINSQVNLQRNSQYITIESHNIYKSPQNSQYMLTGRTKWEKATGPYGFKVDSQMDYSPPNGQKKSLAVYTLHQNTQQQRNLQFKITTKTPSISQPLVTELLVNNQENLYRTKIQAEIGRSASLLNWQLEKYPQGGVKVLDTAVDMTVVRDLLKEILKMTGSETTMATNLITYSDRTYRSRYHHEGPNHHNIMIQTPSVEGQIKYSPSEVDQSLNRNRRESASPAEVYQSIYHSRGKRESPSEVDHPWNHNRQESEPPTEVYLSWNPNRQESEAKYEMMAVSRHTTSGSRYEGRITHPTFNKDMTGLMQYTTSGNSQSGTFELDILPDSADKFTGNLHSTLIANNTVRVELSLQSRVLQISPRASVEASWAPRTKAFDFRFNKTSTSPPSFIMAAKYDQVSRRSATLSMRVVTAEGPVVDFSGVVRSEARPRCNGLVIDAKVLSSVIGNFDIETEMCRPAFIKMITKKHQANKIYITKFGVELPHLAEISIIEADQFGFNKRPIAVIGVELESPFNLETKFGGEIQEARMMKEFVTEQTKRVLNEVWSWTYQVYQQVEQEAHAKGIPFPAPALLKVMTDIGQEYNELYSVLMIEVIQPTWTAVDRFLNGPTASYIKNVYTWLWSNTVHYQQIYTNKIINILQAWRQDFKTITDTLMQGVVEGAQWVKTGQEPELLQRFLQKLDQCRMWQFLWREFLQPLQSHYPAAYQTAQQIIQQLTRELGQDFEKARQYLNSFPATNTIATRLINTFNNEAELMKQLGKLLTSELMEVFAGLESNDRIMTLTTTLYPPIYSLTQVIISAIKIPQRFIMSGTSPYTILLEAYYELILPGYSKYPLLPPYNGTALVFNGTELLTYDGAALRAPRSTCKVLLTSIPGAGQIDMWHPQVSSVSPPQVTFKVGQVEASVSPNFTVTLNGRPVNGDATQPPMTVHVTSQDIRISSPMMGLHILKEGNVMLVNVSRWAFNHTTGLLGSYDGEVANDWLMKNGQNASSLHDLVHSWQEDPSCTTPPVNSINQANLPVMNLNQFMRTQCKCTGPHCPECDCSSTNNSSQMLHPTINQFMTQCKCTGPHCTHCNCPSPNSSTQNNTYSKPLLGHLILSDVKGKQPRRIIRSVMF